MKLTDINRKFLNGEIDKWQYIDEMYVVHQTLFDYSRFLKNSNISEIIINDNQVIFTFRDSGIKFLCSPDDKRLAPFDTLNFGSYEMEEFVMQNNLIDEHFNVFDIGANYGWYALYVAKYKQKCSIYSFEPIPLTFQFLNANIELNNFKNIQTFNFGFSEKKGTFDLFYDPTLSVNASLADLTGSKEVKKVSCKIEKLDDFIYDSKFKVDFIKCDVEGAELFVYKGGVETIRTHLPIIFTEMLRKWTAKFNYAPNDIIEFLNSLGYLCFVLSNGSLKELHHVDENTKETNYYFLHSEKHKEKISKFCKHA
jgi:FkbM family methyltransferase